MAEAWAALKLPPEGPRYRALARVLEGEIEAGRLGGGQRLPPQRDLAYDLGVTVGTVGRAYDLLMRKGLARGEVGRGTFVQHRETGTPRRAFYDVGSSTVTNMTVNAPFRTNAMAEMAALMAEGASSAFGLDLIAGYPPTRGGIEGRGALARWLRRRGLDAPLDGLLLTSGAQAGIAATLAAIGRPGDGVLIEALTFPRFITLARRLGLRPEPVTIDKKGLVPAALDAACRQGRGRILLLSPSMNNPTGAMLDETRRREIVAIAKQHDLTIIEDDVYGPLLPDPPLHLASLAPERTIFVSSLSKFLSPALRIGALLAPPPLIELISQAQGDFAISTHALASYLFVAAERTDLLDRAAVEQRSAANRIQQLARRCLPHVQFTNPNHALHLWVQLGEDMRAHDVAFALAGRGIQVAEARHFAVDPRHACDALRVSLGGFEEVELERLLATIDQTLCRTQCPAAGVI